LVPTAGHRVLLTIVGKVILIRKAISSTECVVKRQFVEHGPRFDQRLMLRVASLPASPATRLDELVNPLSQLICDAAAIRRPAVGAAARRLLPVTARLGDSGELVEQCVHVVVWVGLVVWTEQNDRGCGWRIEHDDSAVVVGQMFDARRSTKLPVIR
jgi:hypothetical protein